MYAINNLIHVGLIEQTVYLIILSFGTPPFRGQKIWSLKISLGPGSALGEKGTNQRGRKTEGKGLRRPFTLPRSAL